MKFTIAVLSVVSTANAFWGTGHLLVARQAEAILESNSPDALQSALDTLAYLKKSDASLTKDEDEHPFTECATFADNIKGSGMSWQSPWHFIDQPYYDMGGDASDYPDFKPDTVDIVDALDNLTKFLKGDSSADSSTYITQVKGAFSDEDDQKSFALRLIIHYHGDIHQPLHTVAAVDKYYPKGDSGGNYEHIPEKGDTGVTNMHSVWDSVIYEDCGYPELPLDSDAWDTLTTNAGDIYTAYPIDQSNLKEGDFLGWATEGLQMAKDYVYKDFNFNGEQTQAYIDRGAPVLKARMMYGSERLAATIESIYGANSAVQEAFLQ